MQPAVIAFSGSIASGKSTLSGAVAAALHCPRASFGDYVRSVARSQGLSESRAVLQKIGADLVEKDVAGFSLAVLAQANWQPGQTMVIDGVRHVDVLDCLRQIVAPNKLYLVFVTVDEATRSERISDRDASSLEENRYLEQDSTEQQVKSLLVEMSDLVVENSLSVEVLVQQIVHWMESQRL
jgi:dephospho-CoA kinase